MMQTVITVFMVIAIFVVSKRYRRLFIVKCATTTFLLMCLSEITTQSKHINLHNNLRPQHINGTAKTFEHRCIPTECRELQLKFLSLQRQFAFINSIDIALNTNKPMNYNILALGYMLIFREATVNFSTLLIMYVNLLTMLMNCIIIFAIGVLDSSWPGDIISLFPVGIAPFLFLASTYSDFIGMINHFPVEGDCAMYSTSWLV